jgi:hypothetical protein
MTNDQMTPGRYLRMMENKRQYAFIAEALVKGLSIQITTITQSRIYSKIEQFRLGKSGVYVRRGEYWDCINGAGVRAI